MKYYRVNDEVYAFEADGSQDGYIPAGAVAMSEAEVGAHLNPKPRPPRLEDLLPVSFAQMRAALVLSGFITREEAKAWAAGVLPAPVEAAIEALPTLEMRIVAENQALSPSSVLPSNPMVRALAETQIGGDPADGLIRLFKLAQSLTLDG